MKRRTNVFSVTVTLLMLLISAFSVYGESGDGTRASTRTGANGWLVYSITPSQAEPGTLVTIRADGLSDKTKVLLGGDELSVQRVDAGHLAFTVPAVKAPGQYALSIRGIDGATRSYAFTVLALRPVLTAIDPKRVTSCLQESGQEVLVSGRNFNETSQLLFDGAVLSSRLISGESIVFHVPKAAGGLHQVTVQNGGEAATPLSFTIISAPVLTAVSVGQDRVNSYELLIEGSNFQQNSVLMVDGVPVDSSGLSPSGQLISIECNRITYLRRPFSSTKRELRMQVVNPSNEVSNIVSIGVP